MPLADIPIDDKPPSLVLDDVRQPGDAGRLQTKEDAGRLEQRRLAVRVRPDDQVQPRGKFRLTSFETTEMADFKTREHFR
jgi:hypothetical protein